MLKVMCYLDTPVITQSPGPVSGIQSQEFSLRCTADGHPDPKYEFFKVSLQKFNAVVKLGNDIHQHLCLPRVHSSNVLIPVLLYFIFC